MVATEQIPPQSAPHKVLRGLEDLRLSTPETVDALFGVTDDEHAGRLARAAVAAQPGQQSLPLQRVGVLELVNQKVAHARVQFLLHPARQHRVAQHDQRGALDVVHVDPAALAFEGGELCDQQTRQPPHALLVQPGFMLMACCGDRQYQVLRLAHQLDADDFFAELARFALSREQSRKNCIHIPVRQGAFQLHPLGRKSRRAGAAQSRGRVHQQLAAGPACQRLVRLLPTGQLRVLLAKGLHRTVGGADGVGQSKLHAFVERGLQGFFRLRTAIGQHHGFKISLQGWFVQQCLVKPPPHQRPGLAVVFQQLVIDRQTQVLQHRHRRTAQQGGKPAMESADLHRTAAGQQAHVQAPKLRRQARDGGLVLQTLYAADLQLVQQPGAVGMGKLAQPFVQALAHLAGSAFGEGDRQNLMRLQRSVGTGLFSVFEQGAQHARDQHPGLARTGAGLDGNAAARVTGDGVKSVRRDRCAVAFVSSLLSHAATRKSRRHRPRASQYSQALPSPMAGMGAPSAMRLMSVLMLSINWSRRLTISSCS